MCTFTCTLVCMTQSSDLDFDVDTVSEFSVHLKLHTMSRYPGVCPTFNYSTYCVPMVYTSPVWPKSCMPSAYCFVLPKRCSHTTFSNLTAFCSRTLTISAFPESDISPSLHLLGAYSFFHIQLYTITIVVGIPSPLCQEKYFTNNFSVSAAFFFRSLAAHLCTSFLVISI